MVKGNSFQLVSPLEWLRIILFKKLATQKTKGENIYFVVQFNQSFFFSKRMKCPTFNQLIFIQENSYGNN